MSLERILAYGLAAILLLAALAKRSNSLKAARIKGNTMVGNNWGTTNQAFIDTSKPSRAEDKDLAAPPADRVAWAIAIVGVLIALAQLVHDVFFK